MDVINKSAEYAETYREELSESSISLMKPAVVTIIDGRSAL